MLVHLTIDGVDCSFDLVDICPRCGIGTTLHLETWSIATIPGFGKWCAIIKCPTCNDLSFLEYELFRDLENEGCAVSLLRAVYPQKGIKNNLPARIKDYFPDFYEIYCQAETAESHNLSLIIGLAYRKALEFLVKKYLMDKHPSEKETIKNETLGASINRIEFPSIKMLARAASWLGNDHAHFVKKHPTYDVENLKAFIDALCHLIISEKVADQAVTLVNNKLGHSQKSPR